MNIHSISKHLIFHFFVSENSTLLIEILYCIYNSRSSNFLIFEKKCLNNLEFNNKINKFEQQLFYQKFELSLFVLGSFR
jgi:hypothetical protein